MRDAFSQATLAGVNTNALAEENRLRPKIDIQCELEFPISRLALTQEYYAKYRAISRILDEAPEIVAEAHQDLKHALEQAEQCEAPGVRFRYTSDQVLRILLVMAIEGLSLRQFTRLRSKPMMDFTTLCKLKNAIRPATWKRINRRLAQHAVREELPSQGAPRRRLGHRVISRDSGALDGRSVVTSGQIASRSAPWD